MHILGAVENCEFLRYIERAHFDAPRMEISFNSGAHGADPNGGHRLGQCSRRAFENISMLKLNISINAWAIAVLLLVAAFVTHI